jgi:hypothetical protein
MRTAESARGISEPSAGTVMTRLTEGAGGWRRRQSSRARTSRWKVAGERAAREARGCEVNRGRAAQSEISAEGDYRATEGVEKRADVRTAGERG